MPNLPARQVHLMRFSCLDIIATSIYGDTIYILIKSGNKCDAANAILKPATQLYLSSELVYNYTYQERNQPQVLSSGKHRKRQRFPEQWW